MKKLDQEILKFKLELEADHAGITSKLEKTVSTQNQNFEVYNEDVFNSLIEDKSHLYDQIDSYPNIYSPLNLNDSNTFQFNPHSFNTPSSYQPIKTQMSTNLLRMRLLIFLKQFNLRLIQNRYFKCIFKYICCNYS